MANNFIYFHTGDFVPKTTFTSFPCDHSSIFITGLDNNNTYLEDSRGLRIYRDGEVFLCTDNTLFNVYTKSEDIYIGEIKIQWDTSCPLKTEKYINDTSNNFSLTTKEITKNMISTNSSCNNYEIIENNSNTTIITQELNSTVSLELKEEVTHKVLGVNINEIKARNIQPYVILLFTFIMCLMLIYCLKEEK